MDQNIQDGLSRVVEIVSAWGLNVLGAIAILVIGFMAAGWLSRATASALGRSARVDETLRQFLASLVRYAVVAFTVLAVLERFGVQTTSFIAVLGAAGLAVGLAFQGTLSHIAAGIMLLLFRPFKVGQYIEAAGVGGTVEAITLFTTSLNTADNVHITLPNGQLWGAAVKNHSHNASRRVDIALAIGTGDDIARAVETVRGVLAAERRVSPTPASAITIGKIAGGTVEVQIQAWCANGIQDAVRTDLGQRLKEALAAAGTPVR